MTEPEFTSAQIMEAIAATIRDGHFAAVPGLIALLARQDPRQAEVVYESMLAALQAHGVTGEGDGSG